MSVAIQIKNAIKRFGSNTVIPDLSVEIKEGEFFTLLGPSGCGKTTLLRMIAGFNSIEGGEFYFDNKLINNLPPHKRNIGMVFQNYAVFPHLTVKNNVGFGLKERKIKEPHYTSRVEQILKSVQISELIERYPSQMSGGQQQRIALARAIVIEPDVLLMDEPLSNLDAKLRVEMRSVIKRIQNDNKITTIYVTHDQEEALSMSDRIAVMKKGIIQQVGAPREVYATPSNIFVATFIGSSNVLSGLIKKTKSKTELEILGQLFELNNKQLEIKNNQKVKVVIRPHEIKFGTKGLKGTISELMYLGSQVEYTVSLEDSSIIEVHVDVNEIPHNIGDTVFVDFDTKVINIFDHETEDNILQVITK